MERSAKKEASWFFPRGRGEALIVIGGLAARLALFFAIIGFIGARGFSDFNDAREYIDLARNIVSHHWFGSGPAFLETNRVPGYPAYLALFIAAGLPLWLASLIQLLGASLVPLLTMRLSGDLGFSGAVSRWAGLFAAFEPLQVYYSVTLLSDALAAVFFLFGVWLLVRFWKSGERMLLVFSALLLGALNYVRPIGMYLFLVIPAVMLGAAYFEARPLKRTAAEAFLFAALFYAALVPWMIRNEREFGSWSMSSAPARQLFDYTASTVRAAADGISFDDAQEKMRREADAYLPVPGQSKHFANAAVLSGRAVAVIRAHPREFFSSYALSLQTLLASGNYHYFLAEYGLIPWPAGGTASFTLLFSSRDLAGAFRALKSFMAGTYGLVALLGKAFWLSVLFLALAGAAACVRAGRDETRFGAILFLALLCYLALVTVSLVGGTEARHRLFLNPFYFIFMAHGIWLAGSMFRARNAAV